MAKQITVNPHEHTTIVAALVHYGMAVAYPEMVIDALDRVAPNPKRPWAEIISEARESAHAMAKAAGQNAQEER